MNERMMNGRDYRLALGFLAGAAVGAALATWFGPRLASGVRTRMTRAGQAAGTLVRKSRHTRDGLADVVARGAHEVERVANSVKSDAPVGPS